LPFIYFAMDRSFNQKSVLGRMIYGNINFLIPYLIFSLFFLILLGIYGNSFLFLVVNENHSKFVDLLFLYITNLGDGIVAFLLILALLRVSFRDAITFLVITLLITIIVNILKNNIFPEFVRPMQYFGTTKLLHLVSGFKPLYLGSFPSGHTATIFSVCMYLSIYSKTSILKLSLFLIAFLVGYSRIYLSAHFPADVVTGAFVGVSVTLVCYYFSRRLKNSWLDDNIVFTNKIYINRSTL
jgi:membrane-associated phospholipid phosphatase